MVNNAKRTYRKNGQGSLGVEVRWGTPELLEDAVRAVDVLCDKARRERLLGKRVIGNRLRVFSLPPELSLNGLQLVTFVPRFDEITDGHSAGGSTDDLKHPLGGVGVGRAVGSALAFKVVNESARILADVAVVDSATSASEEEEAIEFLEEHARGLMNCTEDSLAVGSELAEESANGPRSLGIKTTMEGISNAMDTGEKATCLVGSSRKRRSWGLAASSTPMVRRLRCSTLRPMWN